MADYSKVTKQTLLKNVVGSTVYEINGRRATFKIVYYDDGIPFGFCKSFGIWARLYPKYIATERGEIIMATQISLEKA